MQYSLAPSTIDPSWRENEKKLNSKTNILYVKALLKGKTSKTISGPVPSGRANKNRTELVVLFHHYTYHLRWTASSRKNQQNVLAYFSGLILLRLWEFLISHCGRLPTSFSRLWMLNTFQCRLRLEV